MAASGPTEWVFQLNASKIMFKHKLKKIIKQNFNNGTIKSTSKLITNAGIHLIFCLTKRNNDYKYELRTFTAGDLGEAKRLQSTETNAYEIA